MHCKASHSHCQTSMPAHLGFDFSNHNQTLPTGDQNDPLGFIKTPLKQLYAWTCQTGTLSHYFLRTQKE